MILPDGSASMSPENQLKSLQTRLATLKGTYNEDHPDVAESLYTLGELLRAMARYEDAEPLLRRAVEISEASSEEENRCP